MLIHYADPTVAPGSDHCFRTCYQSVCPYVLFKISQNKTNFKRKTMFTTGETVGLAEWIIDDTCRVIHCCCHFVRQNLFITNLFLCETQATSKPFWSTWLTHSDHYFHTCRPSVRRHFSKSWISKQFSSNDWYWGHCGSDNYLFLLLVFITNIFKPTLLSSYNILK